LPSTDESRPGAPATLAAGRWWARALECGLAFFVLPILLYGLRHHLAYRVVPLVLALAALSAACLVRDATFDRHRLWAREGLGSAVAVFLPRAAVMALATASVAPDRFLGFPLARPGQWLLVMLWYPLLAAVPQEVIFRVFFFHRYAPLFARPAGLIAVNALGFGVAHLIYGNWVAVSLTTLGGALLAYRYHETGSLLVVSFEHGLWGNFLYTVGAGWYLYSGAIR
jgi:membrane protease YdiL (CAAX protease family)